MNSKKIENILNDNIGFIELVDHMGSDLTTVNSARVSFGKRKTALESEDVKLINYLAKHKHTSPFRHIVFQFHVKAPELVARQWYKHIVGSDYVFKDTAWNEISGRYVEYQNEFYVPSKFRKQSANNKQASTNEEVQFPSDCDRMYRQITEFCYETYQELLDQGVCREQARGMLPVSFYTEWYWSASLQAVANFIHLRNDSHAQWEIMRYADCMYKLVKDVCPYSINALLGEYGKV